MQSLYAFKDLKASCYMYMFVSLNDSNAVRVAVGSVENKESIIGRFPSEYALYKMLDIDEISGLVDVSKTYPKFIVDCIVLKETTGAAAPLRAGDPVEPPAGFDDKTLTFKKKGE